jgi:hypothetical protein
MSISTIDNTPQNYITKYIEQTFATHASGNRYDKLHRELLSGIEEIIKLTVNETKHYDKSLEIYITIQDLIRNLFKLLLNIRYRNF